jgi:beta-N-acetylhexosaminidase
MLTNRLTDALMPGLVPGIHVFNAEKKGVDGRDKPGHDNV